MDHHVQAAMMGLPDKPVVKLSRKDLSRFRAVMGLDGDGVVVPDMTVEEKAVRKKREDWKRVRAGKGQAEPCLLYRDEQIAQVKRNIRHDRQTANWFERLCRIADGVAVLPRDIFERLIDRQGPWSGHGIFCPNCVDKKSPQSVHLRFWKWQVSDMDRILCPYCGIVYPHADYIEEGVIQLPRLGLDYRFYLSPEEKMAPDWRLGEQARRFANFPIHVSISGEIRATKLNWALGQVELLGLAFAITGKKSYARAVEAILLRMASVYRNYPLYSYIQDFVDAEPGYAAEHAERIETLFKKNAFLCSYTGVVGNRQQVFGQHETTPYQTRVASGAWGCTRMAREKSSTGQLFLSLFKGYDLVKSAFSDAVRQQIEQDFLLEYYLDVKALSWRVDNKTGPGATARAAVGVFYNDEQELAEGLDYFSRVIDSQYYADGSMKEAPIYAAKPVYETMWELPEMVRGHVDLYRDSVYARGLKMFSEIATPLGTLPPLDDSPVSYSLPNLIADVARVRVGASIPRGKKDLTGLGLHNHRMEATGSYIAFPDQLPPTVRHGFYPVGYEHKRSGGRSSFSLFHEPLPAKGNTKRRVATTHHYQDRGLVCLGYGAGKMATQMYLVAEDGRRGHRHCGPLSILLFAAGREVFPDLGYIADHPANVWIRATPAHNTVTVDEKNMVATGPGEVRVFDVDGAIKRVVVSVPIDGLDVYQRAVTVIQKSDGLPILVDVFDVEGGQVHDYQMRVNEPTRNFGICGMQLQKRTSGLYADLSECPLSGFCTGGPLTTPVRVTWGHTFRVIAHVLTPCDEVVVYHTPAWRDFREVFAVPDKTFDTLVLRHCGKKSRTVVVYELCWDVEELLSAKMEDSVLCLQKRSGGYDEVLLL